MPMVEFSTRVAHHVYVLRLLGLIIVVAYTCVGAMLLADGEGASSVLGLVLVLMGATWLVVDVLRRRRVI